MLRRLHFARFVEENGDREVEELIAEIAAKLDPSTAKAIAFANHLAELQKAELDEAKFKQALSALRSNKAMDADAMLQIGKKYGVIRFGGKSRSAVLEALEKHFYWMLNNRDTDAMARRATPW